MLRDRQVKLSESSVGRVLNKLRTKGLIGRSAAARRSKRTRKFNQYAKRWPYNMKSKNPGELIQIDHMSIRKNGISAKHFQAWDPKTKLIVAELARNADSKNAAKFLEKVIKNLPYSVKSIQVDGGSEFMKHFEEKCRALNIELYVLPPSRPQYNGGVERGNRTFRQEFYAHDICAESINALRYQLKNAVDKYNNFRPHFSLNNMTPLMYT